MRISLDGPTDVAGFRLHCNHMLAQQAAPAEVAWRADVSLLNDESVPAPLLRQGGLASALHAIVPRSFVRLTELVVLHRDESRFDLLYRLLWRMVHEPHAGDVDLARAKAMAASVRRDIARARRMAQLRELSCGDAPPLRFAWCEPQHHVAEEVARGLSRTQSPPWLLATPERCIVWNGRQLLGGPGVPSTLAGKADDANWYRMATQLAGDLLPRA